MTKPKAATKPKTKKKAAIKPKSKSKPKTPAKPKVSLEESNKQRLLHFKEEKTTRANRAFKLMTSHPCMTKGDEAAAIGTLDRVEYSNGYKSKTDAKEAVEKLNKQHFS